MKRSLLKIIVSAVLMLTIIASVAALAGCGNQKITIPDVVGMTKADAESDHRRGSDDGSTARELFR